MHFEWAVQVFSFKFLFQGKNASNLTVFQHRPNDTMDLHDYLIFDYDSTFIQVEGLEELARISLKGNKSREELLKKIHFADELEKRREISLKRSLWIRICLMEASTHHLSQLAELLTNSVSPSIVRNKDFFWKNRDRIFIISGGFREFIEPVVGDFGISPERIFANSFSINPDGLLTGLNRNALAVRGGKINQLNQLGLAGRVALFGDRLHDCHMKQGKKEIDSFAFLENKVDQEASSVADYVISDLDDYLGLIGWKVPANLI